MNLDGGLGVKTVATWLPETTESVADEIATGRLDESAAARLGVTALPVSTDLSAAELAVRAGGTALARAGWEPERVSLVAHAWMYHQGHDKWSAAHYVADRLGLSAALPVGIHELSHGGASALYLAAAAVLANPGSGALVTTADRFGAPVWDRWRSHTDIGYGDGATAALLHRPDGGHDELVLLSMAYSSAPWLEGMERGAQPFTAYPMAGRRSMESNERRRQFYETHGKESLPEAAEYHVRASLHRALGEAGVAPDDPRIKVVTVPRLGPRLVDLMYLRVLDTDLKAELVPLGQRTGHLGAGDLIANLADVAARGLLEPGEIAVMAAAGAGFTWSTAIVQAPPS